MTSDRSRPWHEPRSASTSAAPASRVRRSTWRPASFAAERLRIDTPRRLDPEAVAEVVDRDRRRTSTERARRRSPIGVMLPRRGDHGVVRSRPRTSTSPGSAPTPRSCSRRRSARHRAVVNDADAAGVAEAALRRGQGPDGLVHPDHARHRDRHRAASSTACWSRTPSSGTWRSTATTPRRRAASSAQGARGPELGGVGGAAAALLRHRREPVLAGPDRRRRRRLARTTSKFLPLLQPADPDRAGRARNKAGIVGAALLASQTQESRPARRRR